MKLKQVTELTALLNHIMQNSLSLDEAVEEVSLFIYENIENSSPEWFTAKEVSRISDSKESIIRMKANEAFKQIRIAANFGKRIVEIPKTSLCESSCKILELKGFDIVFDPDLLDTKELDMTQQKGCYIITWQ